MTERAIIFLIIASMIVAVTLIGGITAIVKNICEAKACEATADSLALLREMNCNLDEVNDDNKAKTTV